VEAWEWIVLAAAIGAAVIFFIVVATTVFRRRRRSHLKERFGPEYERAVSSSGQKDAERRLSELESSVDELAIRSLPGLARDRYLEEWRHTESRFVSDPQDAVRAAERIVMRVLEDRGYPGNGDLDEQSAYLAADYPDVAERYRHAHDAVLEAEQTTEVLRRAMLDLRSVFEELLVRERVTAGSTH
jgi:hypothetical protein